MLSKFPVFFSPKKHVSKIGKDPHKLMMTVLQLPKQLEAVNNFRESQNVGSRRERFSLFFPSFFFPNIQLQRAVFCIIIQSWPVNCVVAKKMYSYEERGYSQKELDQNSDLLYYTFLNTQSYRKLTAE